MTPLRVDAESLSAITTLGDLKLRSEASGTTTVSNLATTTGVIELTQVNSAGLAIESVSTTAGDIVLSNQSGDLSVGTAVAGGAGFDIRLTTELTGNVLVDSLTAAGDSVLITAAGAIDQISTGDPTTDVTADKVTLIANTGIGLNAAVQLAANMIEAAATNGEIALENTATGPTTVSRLVTGTGNLRFDQTGGFDLKVLEASTSNGSIQLTNSNGELQLIRAAAAGAGSNLVVRTSGAGDLRIDELTAALGTIQLVSAGAIEELPVADAGLDLIAAEVSLNASSGIGALDALEMATQGIEARTAAGAIDLTNDSVAAVTVTDLSTVGNSITLSQLGGGELSITGTVSSGTATVAGGRIELINDGRLVVQSTATLSSAGGTGGQLSVTRATLNTTPVLGAGDIVLQGNELDVLVTSALISDTTITVSAPRDIIVSALIRTDGSQADILLTADSDLDGSGGLWIQSAGQLDSSRNVLVTGADLFAVAGTVESVQVDADGIQTQIEATGRIDILPGASAPSNAHMILNGLMLAGTELHVAANESIIGTGHLVAPILELRASSGIGLNGPLQISVDTLTASTSEGDIRLASSAVGQLTVEQLTTGTGSIVLDQVGNQDLQIIQSATTSGAIEISNAGGSLFVESIDAGGPGGNVRLVTNGAGDLSIAQITAVDDQVSLQAAGAINELAALTDSDIDITAAAISFTAGSGIGQIDPLELASQQLSAVTAIGDIILPNTSATSVLVADLVTVGGDLTVDQTGGGDIEFRGTITSGGPLTDGGTIALTSDAGLLVASTATLSSAGGAGGKLFLNRASLEVTPLLGAGDIILNGANLDVIIGAALSSSTSIRITAPRDIIVRETIETTRPDADIVLEADSDNDGSGGVWIQQSGLVAADGHVQLSGSDVYSVAGTVEAVLIEDDPGALQVQAGNTVTLAPRNPGTTSADITVRGDLQALVQINLLADSGINASGHLIAPRIQLTASTGIGDQGPLEFTADTLWATTVTGDITLDSLAIAATTLQLVSTGNGDITIAQQGGQPLNVEDLSTGDGSVDISNDEGLLSIKSITAAGPGSTILLATTGTTGDVEVAQVSALDQITIQSAGSIRERTVDSDAAADLQAQSIELTAGTGIGGGDRLELQASVLSTSTTSGDISLSSLANTAVTVTQLTSDAGHIDFQQTGNQSLSVLSATTTSGDIRLINTGGDLLLTDITAAGNAVDLLVETIGSGDIRIDRLSARDNTLTVRSAESVNELGGSLDADSDLLASRLIITAAGGIGATDPLEVTVETLDVRARGTVDLNSLAGSHVLVERLVTTAGDLRFVQTGGFDLNLIEVSTPSGNVTLTNSAGSLIVESIEAAANGASVSLTTTGLGDILLDRIDVQDGTVQISAAGAVSELAALSDPDIDITATAISFTAGTGIGHNDALELSAQQLSAVTSSGDIVLMNSATTAVTVSDLTTIGGRILFNQSGGADIEFTGRITSGNSTTDGGDIQLTGDARLAVTNTAILSTAGGTGGELFLSGASLATAPILGTGDIRLAGADLDVVIAATISSAAAIHIEAERDIIVQQSLETTAAGADINLRADADNDGSGGIWVQQTGAITAANAAFLTGADVFAITGSLESIRIDDDPGQQQVTAGAQITLATAPSTPAAADMVIHGDLESATTINVAAAHAVLGSGHLTAPDLQLTATASIGGGGPLELTAQTLTATTTSGVIELASRATTTTTLQQVSTGSGDISFEQTGDQTLNVVSFSTDNGAILISNQNALLSVTEITAKGAAATAELITGGLAGDVEMAHITATQEIRITAAGAIRERATDSDAAIDLDATTITLAAGTGIGSGDPLELHATSIAATTADGDVSLISRAETTVVATNLSTTTGTITLNQTGGHSLAIQSATTTDGAITLTNADGDLSLNTVTAGGTGRDILIETTGSGDLQVDHVDATDDTLTLRAAGSIRESNGNIDPDADLIAGSLVMTAAAGIGAAEPLEIAVTSVDVSAGDSVQLQSLAEENVTVTRLVTTAGDLQFNQTGGFTLTVVEADTPSGDITIDNIGAELNVESITALGTAAQVTLTTTGTGDITLDEILAAAGTVELHAAGAINERNSTSDPDIDITATAIHFTAGTGIGTSNPLELVTQLLSATTTTGDITLANTSAAAVTITDLITGSGAITYTQVGGGAATFTGTISSGSTVQDGGSIRLENDGRLTVAASAELNTTSGSGGVVTISGATLETSPLVGAGSITLIGNSPDVIVAAGITTDAAITITADRDIIVRSTLRSTAANADITLTADADGDTSGGVLVEQAGFIDGAARVTLTGSDLFVINGTIEAVQVDSDPGQTQIRAAGILEVGPGPNAPSDANTVINGLLESATQILVDANAALTGNGLLTAPLVMLTATAGIGLAGPLNVNTALLNANTTTGDIALASQATRATTVQNLSTTTGTITLNQTGGHSLAIQSATTTDGAITLTNADGDLSLNTVTAGGTRRDILIETTGTGDLQVDHVDATDDTLTLRAAGSIRESTGNIDPDADLIAGSLVMTAAAGIGAAEPLEITVASVHVSAGDSVQLQSLAGENVTVTRLVTTAGDLRFAQTRGFTLTVVEADTPSGDITIDNTGAGLIAESITALAASAQVTLTTAGTGDITLDGIQAAAGTVELHAAGAINERNSTSDLDIDITATAIHFTAGTGIGNINPLELATQQLSARTTVGNVVLPNQSRAAVTVTDITTDGGSITVQQTGGGDIQFTGSITSGSGAADGGTIILTSDAGLTVTSTATLSSAVGDGGELFVTGATLASNPTVGAGDIVLRGASDDVVVDTDLSLPNSVHLSANRDIIVRSSIATTATPGDIVLTADLDSDSIGGIWIQATGLLDSAGDVRLSGSDLFAVSPSIESILVDDDPGRVQVTAAGSISLAPTSVAPATADVSIQGVIESATAITADASAALIGTGQLIAPRLTLTANTGIGLAGPLNLTADTLTAVTTNGNVSLISLAAAETTVERISTATGEIEFSQSGSQRLIVREINTSDGSVTVSNEGADIEVASIVADGVGSDILITTVGSGTIAIDMLAATGDSIEIVSADAIEEQVSSNDAAVDLSAGQVVLAATTGIGTLDALELSADQLSIRSTSGDIDLTSLHAGSVNVSTLQTSTGSVQFTGAGGSDLRLQSVVNSAGAITLTNETGLLLVEQLQATGASGEVRLSTTDGGAIEIDNLSAAGRRVVIDSDSTINEQSSRIDTTAEITADQLELQARGDIGNLSPLELTVRSISANSDLGSIQLHSLADQATVMTLVSAGNGLIDLVQTGGHSLSVETAVANGGSVSIVNTGGSLEIAHATAIGNGVDVTLRTIGTGDISVNEVIAQDDLIRVESAGSIVEFGSDSEAEFASGRLILSAVSGIGAGAPIEFTATLAEVVSVAGDISLSSLAQADLTVSRLVTGTGIIDLDQSGGHGLIIEEASTGSGSIQIRNTGGDLEATNIVAGGIGADIILGTLGSGNLTVGHLEAEGDRVSLNSAGRLDESARTDPDVDVLAASIEMTAVSGIGDIDPLELSGSTITAQTGAGNITLSNVASGAVEVRNLSTVGGSIEFAQFGGDLTLTGLVTSGNTGTPGGSIFIESDGSLRVDSTATLSSAAGSGGRLLVRNANLLTTPILGAGDITLIGSDLDVIIGSQLVSDTTISIEASRDIIVRDLLRTTMSTADIILAADSDGDSIGGVLVETTGIVESAGAVTLTGSDVFAVSGTVEAVQVEAGVGARVSADSAVFIGPGPNAPSTADTTILGLVESATRIEIVAAGSVAGTGWLRAHTVDLTAETGIGISGPLEITAAELNAATTTGDIDLSSLAGGVTRVLRAVTGVGEISIAQSGGATLTVESVETVNGSIRLANTSGDLEVRSAVAGGPGADVELVTTTAGDILIDEILAVDDTIRVSSAGRIEELAGQIDPEADLQSAAIELSAGLGIGTNQALELTTAAVSAAAGAGGIDLNSLATGVLAVNQLQADSGSLRLQQTGGHALNVSSALALHGSIELVNVAGHLNVQSAIANGIGADVTLESRTTGDLTIAYVEAIGDRVVLKSAGSVNETTSDADVDVRAFEIVIVAGSGAGGIDPLEFAASEVSATTTTGDLVVSNTSSTGVTVTDLTTVGGRIQFDQIGGGDITFTGILSSGDAFTDGGSITFNSDAGLLVASTATLSTASGSGGRLSLNRASLETTPMLGAGDITLNGASLDVIIGAALVSGTTIQISAPRDIIIRELVETTVTAANIELTADSDLDGVGGIWIQESGFVHSAGDALLQGSELHALASSSESIQVDADASGPQIDAAGSIHLQPHSVAPATADVILNGTLVSGTRIEVAADAALRGSGYVNAPTVVLAALTGIGLDGPLNVTATQLDAISAVGAIDLQLIATGPTSINHLSTGVGSITLNQVNGSGLTIELAITDSGPIEIVTDQGGLILGQVIAGGPGSTVVLQSTDSGDITLDDVQADSQISVDAAGLINERSGSSDPSVDLAAKAIDLVSGGGIGAGGALELSTGTLSASSTNGVIDMRNLTTTAVDIARLVTGAGTIRYEQQGGHELHLTEARTDDGTITILNDSSISTGSVIAGGLTGDVRVTATGGGDIEVDSMIAVGNVIQLSAEGAIRESTTSPDVDTDLQTRTLSLQAGQGIGDLSSGAGAIEISAARITADTLTGDVSLTNDALAAVIVHSVSTGSGSLVFEQTGDRALSLTAARAADGSILVTNTGADLTIDLAEATGTGSRIDIQTTNAGDVILQQLAAVDTVSIEAAGSINESTGSRDTAIDIAAATVQLQATSGIGQTEALELATSSFAAVTIAGAVNVTNTTGLATSVSELRTGAGDIRFAQNGGGELELLAVNSGQGSLTLTNENASLKVVDAMTSGATSDILLETTGSGDILLDRVESTDAAVTIRAAGSLNQNAFDADIDLVARTLTVAAGTGVGNANPLDVSAETLSIASVAGDIDLNSSAASPVHVNALSTGDGSIRFAHDGSDVSFVGAVTSGNSTTNGGDILLTGSNSLLIDTTATVSTETGAGGRLSVRGAVLRGEILLGAGDITILGGDNITVIETDIDTETPIEISSPQDIIVSTRLASTDTVRLIADTDADGTGGVWIQQSGEVRSGATATIEGADLIAATGNQSVDARPAVTLYVADDTQPQITASSGVSIRSGTAAPAHSDTVLDGGLVTTTGLIEIQVTGTIDGIGRLAGPAVSLDAVDGIGALSPLNLQTGRIDAVSDSGPVRLINTPTSDVEISQLRTGQGDISVRQSGGFEMTLSGPVSSGSAGLSGGLIALDNDALITVAGVISSADGTGGSLSIEGSTVNVTPIVGAGDIRITGQSIDTIINADLITDQPISIAAERDIIVNAVLSSSDRTGSIDLVADSDANGQGGVLITGTGQIFGAGNVLIRGSDLTSTTGVLDSVVVQPPADPVFEPRVAAGGQLEILSTLLVTNADIILDGAFEAGGLVRIVSSDDLMLGAGLSITNQDQPVSLTAGAATGAVSGQLVMSATTTVNSASGLIELTATGDILLGIVQTGSTSSSAVTVLTTGGLIESRTGGTSNLSAAAGGVLLQAANGIGSITDAIQTTTPQLSARTDQGPVILTNSQTGPVRVGELGTGQGAIQFLDRLASLTEILTVENTDGSITLQSLNGQLRIHELGSEGTNGSVTAFGLTGLQLDSTFEAALKSVQLSTAGAITGDATIRSASLEMQAEDGIGSDRAMSIATGQLAVENTGSGAIQLNHVGSVPLVVGQVGTTMGILNSGTSGAEPVLVTSRNGMTIDSPVQNLTGGDVRLTTFANSAGTSNLTINGPLVASGGDGSIYLTAGNNLTIRDSSPFNGFLLSSTIADISVAGTGKIIGNAGGTVSIGDDVLIRSATGAITASPPSLTNVQLVSTADVGAQATRAEISGSFGRTLEQSFTVVIDWGDGTIQSMSAVNPGTFSFQHDYVSSGFQSIPVTLTLFDDANIQVGNETAVFSTTIEVRSFAIADSSDSDASDAAVSGLNELGGASEGVDHSSDSGNRLVLESQESQQVQDSSTSQEKNSSTEVAEIDKQEIRLRVLAPNGTIKDEITLKPEQLDELTELFGRLPNGRYQIVVREAGEQQWRTLRDVQIRGGRIIDADEELRYRQQSEPDDGEPQSLPAATADPLDDSDHAVDERDVESDTSHEPDVANPTMSSLIDTASTILPGDAAERGIVFSMSTHDQPATSRPERTPAADEPESTGLVDERIWIPAALTGSVLGVRLARRLGQRPDAPQPTPRSSRATRLSRMLREQWDGKN